MSDLRNINSAATQKAQTSISNAKASADSKISQGKEAVANAQNAVSNIQSSVNNALSGLAKSGLQSLSNNVMNAIMGKLSKVPAMGVLLKVAALGTFIASVTNVVKTMANTSNKIREDTKNLKHYVDANTNKMQGKSASAGLSDKKTKADVVEDKEKAVQDASDSVADSKIGAGVDASSLVDAAKSKASDAVNSAKNQVTSAVSNSAKSAVSSGIESAVKSVAKNALTSVASKALSSSGIGKAITTVSAVSGVCNAVSKYQKAQKENVKQKVMDKVLH